jgi:uncharacterized protein (TIGR03067 family)
MHGLAVVVIVSLFAGLRLPAADGDAKDETVAKDLQAFKGTWRLSSRELDGKQFGEDEIKDVIMTNDGTGRCSVRRGDKVIAEATAQLDPTKKPKAVDITFSEGEHKGMTALGIYEIEGDTFRVCCARPGDERPAEFSARAGSGRTLIVYKRQK